jgi:hypothetical protein
VMQADRTWGLPGGSQWRAVPMTARGECAKTRILAVA